MDIRRIAAEETIDLRHRVMWPDLPRDAVRVPGDEGALHFGAFDGVRLIGVASFFPDGPAYQLRKLAVEPEVQGQGVASRLLEVAIRELKALGAEAIWCDARVTATGFYARNGFVLEGAVFQKQGLDYVVARKAL